MASFYIIGQLGGNIRGKRLAKALNATAVGDELPEAAGMCIGCGQDYQTKTPAGQREWLAWAARPGCVMLLLPPFQTGVRHEPNGWEVSALPTPVLLDPAAHLVLMLCQPEINVRLNRGLSSVSNPVIEAGTQLPLSGLHRKHPDSGIFGATAVPVWSIALADRVSELQEWLDAWMSLAGRPVEISKSGDPSIFEPSQSHYSVLLYLASGNFSSRSAALDSLAWNDTFELAGEHVPRLLDELEAAGLTADGRLCEQGVDTLLESPYRHYAETLLTR
jgi:hypothetical protein